MRTRTTLVVPFLVGLVSVALAACNSDPSSGKKTEGPKVKEVIPDNMVVNDFFPEKGGKARPIVDASIGEGGLAGVAAASGDAGASPADDGDDGAIVERKITVLEPGAEPRTQKRYAFKTQTEARKVTMAVKSLREGQGQKQEDAQPLTTVNMVFTLKGQSAGAFQYDALIKNVDLELPANADKRQVAQAKAALDALKGIKAQISVTSRGTVGDAKFESDKLPRGAAEQIMPLFSQVFEFIVAPLPEEAVGVGAKWQETTDGADRGIRSKVIATYTLKEWNAEGGVIDAEVKRSAPRQQVQDPRMPGAAIRLEGKGTYHFEVKTNGLVQKASGENNTVLHIDAPGPSGKPEPALTETTSVKHTVEMPAAGH
jgi:hypothetical protein